MRLLLETHVDPAVARELAKLVPELDVELQQHWRGGLLRTADDNELLTAAHEDGYVCVSFDVTTIPLLLTQRYERDVPSPGVILVSRHTFPQNDIAGIARALARVWQRRGGEEWAGRVIFLAR